MSKKDGEKEKAEKERDRQREIFIAKRERNSITK